MDPPTAHRCNADLTPDAHSPKTTLPSSSQCSTPHTPGQHMQEQAHLLIQLLILAIPERRTEHDAVKVVFIESTESTGAL